MGTIEVITVRQRAVATFVTTLLLGAFAIVLIAAGHGVGSIGYLLLEGSLSAWGLPVIIAWSGVILVVLALFCRKVRSNNWLASLGGACLVVAWWVFVTATEDIGFTLLTSIPFLGLLIVYGFCRNSRLHFSLRTLLIAVTLVAVGLGLLMRRW